MIENEYGVIIRRSIDEDCIGHKCGGIEYYEVIKFGEVLSRTPSEELLKDVKHMTEAGKSLLSQLPHRKSLTLQLDLED